MNRFLIAAAAAVIASPLVAQTDLATSDQSAFDQATAAGVCGAAGVATAVFVNPAEISVTCNEDEATAFVPLLGGLAPLLLGGAAAVALAATAAGDGGTTPDTQ